MATTPKRKKEAMEREPRTPQQRQVPDWAGWVVVVTMPEGDGWVNGLFSNEEEAETHAELERADGRNARALTLWTLDKRYMDFIEGLTYEDDEDEQDDDETADRADAYDNAVPGVCWKCQASTGAASLCPECLAQQ
jgi:hypothetical protein